jgi:hypothetical protein
MLEKFHVKHMYLSCRLAGYRCIDFQTLLLHQFSSDNVQNIPATLLYTVDCCDWMLAQKEGCILNWTCCGINPWWSRLLPAGCDCHHQQTDYTISRQPKPLTPSYFKYNSIRMNSSTPLYLAFVNIIVKHWRLCWCISQWHLWRNSHGSGNMFAVFPAISFLPNHVSCSE